MYVRLKNPNAAMLDHIGRTRIIPKHIWEGIERPREFTAPEAVIGSGPYRLTHYSKTHGTYRFEAFEDFWGPRPRVRTIEFVPVSEPILAYEKGEIDLTTVTPDVRPRFAGNPDHRIVRSPAFWGYRLLLNMAKVPAFREVAVRQALIHAIDRQELVDKIARGPPCPDVPASCRRTTSWPSKAAPIPSIRPGPGNSWIRPVAGGWKVRKGASLPMGSPWSWSFCAAAPKCAWRS